MSIQYNKLFKKLEEQGISKTGLQKSLKISSTTLSKLAKNEYVSLKVIDDICRVLACQPHDIMEYIPLEPIVSQLITKLKTEKRNKNKQGIYPKLQIFAAMNGLKNSSLNFKQMEEIYFKRTVTVHNQTLKIADLILINNSFSAIDYIIEHVREPLSIEQIRIIYRILSNNTYLSKKIIKYTSEYLVLTKKHEFEYILQSYHQKEAHDLTDILKMYETLMELSPLVALNYEVFRLICFKESLLNNIEPFFINQESIVLADIYDSQEKLALLIQENSNI